MSIRCCWALVATPDGTSPPRSVPDDPPGGSTLGSVRGRRAATIAMSLSAVGFAVLSLVVWFDATPALDRWLVAVLRTPGTLDDPLGPEWLRDFVLDITHAGGRSVLGLFSVLAAGFLAVMRLWRELGFATAALLGGIGLSDIFKALFGRVRPDFVPHLAEETSSSFPSGHATYAAIAYITFALLLGRLVPNRVARAYLAGAAAGLVMLVGFSRVYLGVHYPSDVLAGWCLGTSWALGCWLTLGRPVGR